MKSHEQTGGIPELSKEQTQEEIKAYIKRLWKKSYIVI